MRKLFVALLGAALFGAALFSFCVAQGGSNASAPTGASTASPASVTVDVRPSSATVTLTGVTVGGAKTDLELSNAVPQTVEAGAYVLAVRTGRATTASAVTRAIQVEAGKAYSFTFDLAGTGATDSAPALNWPLLSLVMAIVLTLSIGMIVYFHNLQAKFYRLTASMVGRVGKVEVVNSSTLAHRTPTGVERSLAFKSPQQLELTYPREVFVGVESQPFRVKGPPSGVTIQWSLEPAGMGVLRPSADGTSATVVAAKPGVLEVSAQGVDPSGAHHVRTVEVASTEGRSDAVQLPWVGQGIGAFVIGVFVLGIALALAMARIFDATAMSTLLVAIAGYAFGQVQSSK